MASKTVSQAARRHASLSLHPQSTSANVYIPDSAYIARYRSVKQHDAVYQRHPVSGQVAGPAPNVQVPKHKRERLDLERAWLGGDTEDTRFDPIQKSEHAKPLALLFPGSGSQYSGMGQSLLDNFASARLVWEEAEEALAGFDKWRKDLHLEDVPELQGLRLPEWDSWITERAATDLRKLVFGGRQDLLTRSSNAQPAILITSIAFLRSLEIEFETPVSAAASFVAGHSSGEYTAAVATGSISFAEGVRLTRLLGLLSSRTLFCSHLQPSMNLDAPPEERSCMSALIINPGHTHDEVSAEVKRSVESGACGLVEIASFNSASQIVLAGSRAGVLCAAERLTELGIAARAADLPIAAPFHCSFMQPTAAGMASALVRAKIGIKAPSKPMLSGVNAQLVRTPDEVRTTLVAGIPRPVLWSSLIRKLREEEGVGRMIFCGPGKALASMARKDQERGHWHASEHIDIGSISTMQDLNRVKEMFT